MLKEPVPVGYNAKLPIETFDFIITDECHRSIYNLWRQALEYFDAFIVGLTATPSKQTLGFFDQNLVMEYNHDQAVADAVNVDFEVYRIPTLISEHGSTVKGPRSWQSRSAMVFLSPWGLEALRHMKLASSKPPLSNASPRRRRSE